MKPSFERAPALLAAGALIVSLFSFSSAASAQDVEKGKEINGTCAACHGELGQGGKKGEYPRLAGQRSAYMIEQLMLFREKKRVNIPMFPYTQERELSDEDIRDVSAYLAGVVLSTKMPVFKGDEDALTRLLAVDKVMIIPRVEGNIENGGRIYGEECAGCHGKSGLGGGRNPMLVGQYTSYLKKQMDSYLKAERPHDEDNPNKGVLKALKESDLQDVLAYLTSIQERE